MKYFFLFVLTVFSSILTAQNDYTFECAIVEEDNPKFDFSKFKRIDNKECKNKIIRLNIHFILREDNTGNFNETDDGFGNPFSGYDFAFQLIDKMNVESNKNSVLNIPEGHNIPNLPKEYFFTLNGVYFHRDNNAIFSPGNVGDYLSAFGEQSNEVINVFFTWAIGGGGYASLGPLGNLGTVIHSYTRYTNYLNAPIGTDNIDWFWHSVVNTTHHEIGHNLGLSHTSRFGGGGRVPVEEMAVYNDVTNECEDFIFNSTNTLFANDVQDTPTPLEMYSIYNSTCHPACGWGKGEEFGCSNNLMDYAGSYALSPGQLNLIHIGLENSQGTKRFRACLKLNQDKVFCEFEGYPQISYYGDKIKIAPCPQEMIVEEEAIVHYNEEVEFSSGFEVVGSEPRNDNLVFEVRQHCKCRL